MREWGKDVSCPSRDSAVPNTRGDCSKCFTRKYQCNKKKPKCCNCQHDGLACEYDLPSPADPLPVISEDAERDVKPEPPPGAVPLSSKSCMACATANRVCSNGLPACERCLRHSISCDYGTPLAPSTAPSSRRREGVSDLEWIWHDTCCIDKSSSAELNEAINSMFRYYADSYACLAFLQDVHPRQHAPSTLLLDFEKSSWFKRGWTLQELLAPKLVVFLNQSWEVFGHKAGSIESSVQMSSSKIQMPLNPWISRITGMPERILLDYYMMKDIPIEKRLDLMAGRTTTRREDKAYCLLGICDVFMPLIYGEGKRAFDRLEEVLNKESVQAGGARVSGLRDRLDSKTGIVIDLWNDLGADVLDLPPDPSVPNPWGQPRVDSRNGDDAQSPPAVDRPDTRYNHYNVPAPAPPPPQLVLEPPISLSSNRFSIGREDRYGGPPRRQREANAINDLLGGSSPPQGYPPNAFVQVSDNTYGPPSRPPVPLYGAPDYPSQNPPLSPDRPEDYRRAAPAYYSYGEYPYSSAQEYADRHRDVPPLDPFGYPIEPRRETGRRRSVEHAPRTYSRPQNRRSRSSTPPWSPPSSDFEPSIKPDAKPDPPQTKKGSRKGNKDTKQLHEMVDKLTMLNALLEAKLLIRENEAKAEEDTKKSQHSMPALERSHLSIPSWAAQARANTAHSDRFSMQRGEEDQSRYRWVLEPVPQQQPQAPEGSVPVSQFGGNNMQPSHVPRFSLQTPFGTQTSPSQSPYHAPKEFQSFAAPPPWSSSGPSFQFDGRGPAPPVYAPFRQASHLWSHLYLQSPNVRTPTNTTSKQSPSHSAGSAAHDCITRSCIPGDSETHFTPPSTTDDPMSSQSLPSNYLNERNALDREILKHQPQDYLQYAANFYQRRLEAQRKEFLLSAEHGQRHSSQPGSETFLSNPFGNTAASSQQQQAPGQTGGKMNPVSEEEEHDDFASPTASSFPPNVRDNSANSNMNTSGSSSGGGVFGNFGFSPSSGTRSNPPPSASSGAMDHPQSFPQNYNMNRRTSVSAESLAPTSSDDTNWKAPQYPKTAEQISRLRSAVSHNFLFSHLDDEQTATVLGALQERKMPSKDMRVITQGEEGDYFYVVESGQFDIYVSKTGHVEAGEGGMGSKVATNGPGTSFGELALMYNAPRAATVVSQEPSVLWQLDRVTFRRILMDSAFQRRRMYESFLEEVPLLSSLTPYERSKIADALETTKYPASTPIIREGDVGDKFYILESGEAEVTKRGESQPLKHYGKGDYFGELALLEDKPRFASVTSTTEVKVATLGKDGFQRLLGPVESIMRRDDPRKNDG
ncbi:uncharacterized protein LTR77_009450 [Saxophila tyrrhenica]|uniref:cAMP-dependent protein kinase regulatory subunit n=1 Tax=Saxophila tyrrhenica TaxID=1690608 RepID=A0AAV9NZH4_9PEZI|nr:hypothetical protein LTR77_009450 [Saxophila tyrrhenica]